MVLSFPAIVAGVRVCFYTDPFWTKLDRQTGNETPLQRPADQDQHQACGFFPVQ